MQSTSTMKGHPSMGGGSPMASGMSIGPEEVHANRFLLYAITFLLCTPSAFKDLVESGGDLDIWLKDIGIDSDAPFSRTRNICAEYVNQIMHHPTVYPQMAELHQSLKTLSLSSTRTYTGPACPTFGDAKAIARCMLHLNTTEHVHMFKHRNQA